MYTGPLVRDEQQLGDNDGKWLTELSLQIPAGFSAKTAWVSVVPVVKNGKMINAHHSNESRANCNEENNTNKTPPANPGEGKTLQGPRLLLPNGHQAAHNQQKEGPNFQHGHVRIHGIYALTIQEAHTRHLGPTRKNTEQLSQEN